MEDDLSFGKTTLQKAQTLVGIVLRKALIASLRQSASPSRPKRAAPCGDT